ncbi:MAG: hypothetical protein A2X81_18180 [Desulfobacterales bacterium GWB2_56_26]|nr:MAG: hypothetical protein A2X81_18180 [Desulfobacterales bacterium GWB2_56_26]
MSAAPNPLVEIYRQLSEQFSCHRAISLVPTKGDPPDRYEISYNVKGLSRPAKGDVIETTGHIVELTIPFGFPHFPPSCKPKSNIFHPDFDPAAICLGDFWHQDCQLPDLVLYIGRMINGEFYSRTNAFNEEACIWYGNHPDVLPLAEVEWRERQAAQDVLEKNDKPDIDTLDESDLCTTFDFLAIDEVTEKEESPDEPPSVAPAPTYDADLLNLFEKQKRFFTLRESVKRIDSDNLPEELKTLAARAKEAISQAEDLFRESRKAEKRGDARSAFDALAKINEIAEDFPDLENHLRRLREAAEGEPEAAISRVDKSAEDREKKAKAPRSTGKIAAIPSFRWNRKIIGSLLAGSVAIFLAASGYSYWSAMTKLDAAEAASSRCTALLEKGEFENAKRSCEEALTISNNVKFIMPDRVEQLRKHLGQTLQSEKMNQGLKGMVLVDGIYLAKKDAEIIETSRQLRTEAEEFYHQKNWQPAIDRYARVLAMPVAPHVISAEIAADVKTKHDFAQFRLVHDSALQSLQNGKWREAVTELIKAEGLLHLLPEGDRSQYVINLKNALAKSTFEQSREQGDLFFANSEWQKAMAAYELALSTTENVALPKESFDMIHRNMKRAELYDLIDQGIKSFGAGAWDEAIGDYRKAEEFLASHQAHLNVTDAEKNIKKLSRIILQSLIVRDRQLAADHLEKNELPVAGNIYRRLIDRIDNSPFSGEGEFLAARNEFYATVQTLDEKMFIAEKSSYLENEYRPLFAANYPTAVAANLVNPHISFTKDTGDKAVFKMQCTETGGGRPLTLVMYYAFNKKNGQWELHSEQQ